MLQNWFIFALAFTLPCSASQGTNWSGPYRPCLKSAELLKTGHLEIGVRFDTANPASAAALREALRFWSNVIDINVYDEQSENCAIAIVDATPEILAKDNYVARAQFTDWENFQGWIAFDPHISGYMNPGEIYATAVHELGHLFGLVHNPDITSVMYYLDVDGSAVLDAVDLKALAARHAMRLKPGTTPVLSEFPGADRRNAQSSHSFPGTREGERHSRRHEAALQIPPTRRHSLPSENRDAAELFR